MCGITGCLSKDAMKSVIQGITKLQNRGYDSTGISTIVNNEILIQKYISDQNNAIVSIINDPMAILNCNLAIGHTRWATHGPKTIENAHPHYTDRFSLIHNGIIENYLDLKKELNYTFYGQTDSEVIVKYLDFLYHNNKDYTYLDKILIGSWAILFLDKENPDKIYFMKNKSPLIIGYNDDLTKIMIVSELIGFDPDIKYYFSIDDRDFGYVSLKYIESTKKYIPLNTQFQIVETSPSPYSHWTIKEIHDQPSAISSLLQNRIIDNTIYLPELECLQFDLINVKNFIFLGCGTSYHAAQIGARFFKEFNSNINIQVIDGADFEKNDITDKNTILILLSQSGETQDLYRALSISNLKSIGIINVENSLIAREVSCCLYIKAKRENAVASTKSFTNQVIMLLLLSMWLNPFHPLINKYINSLKNLSLDFIKMIEQSKQEIPHILNLFKNQSNCFILGKHISEWIAKEGSLKIKEISYIHSEGFSAASLKHGPFALLTDNIPVVILANDDLFFSKILNITSEIKSRSANVIFITNKLIDTNKVDHLLYFNSDSVLFPLLTIIPLQLLSYYLSIDRNINPDYPRNLAKVVSVE